MSVTKQSSVKSTDFYVASVEKTDAPEGMDGDNWFRYVIERDDTDIVGVRCGTLQEVTRHAREYAENLNSRSGFRGTSIWAPRKSNK